MARPLRLEFAGALYHVTSRGNRREMIYASDDDRRNWLSVLDPLEAVGEQHGFDRIVRVFRVVVLGQGPVC